MVKKKSIKSKIKTISVTKKAGILTDLKAAHVVSASLNKVKPILINELEKNIKLDFQEDGIAFFRADNATAIMHNIIGIVDSADDTIHKKLELDIKKIIQKAGLKDHSPSLHNPRRYVSHLKLKNTERIPFDLFEIHCPKIKGSTATLEKQQSTAKGGGFKVTFAGFGGGATFEKTMTISDETVTENGDCLKLQTELIYDTYEFEVKCLHDGCKYTSGIGAVTELRENHEVFKQNPIGGNEDGCLKPKKGFAIHEYEVGGGKKTPSFEIAKNTKMGLEAAPTGFPIQINATIETLQKIKFSYLLPSPNKYMLYSKTFPKYWESTPIKH